MAATISSSFSLHSQQQQQQQQQQEKHSLYHNTHFLKPLSFTPKSPKHSHPLLLLHKFNHFSFTPSFATSHSQTPSESSSPTSLSEHPSLPSLLNDPLRTGQFLTAQDLEKLRILENFRYFHEFESGSLLIRVMRREEMDITVGLLSESFAESMSMAFSYVPLVEFLVKQYLLERIAVMPNMATLVGFYREEGGEEELAGTVEVSFNKKGANTNPPTPTPPRDSPYICNMTVKNSLRRRGIGWNLLKACEELISQMTSTSNEVYLHCRMIDTAPFKMYTKAGYNVIKTDNILILLMLQRRKHLMYKKFPIVNNTSESDISQLEDNIVS